MCLDVPSCPEPAAPFLCVGRPHLSGMSQKHHSQIQRQAGWWRSPLHPLVTETEGGQSQTQILDNYCYTMNTLYFLGYFIL